MPKLALALKAIRANARQHESDEHRPDLCMLAEEVIELIAALNGKHEHAAWYELVQIGGIAANWIAGLVERDGDFEIVTFIEGLEGQIYARRI